MADNTFIHAPREAYVWSDHPKQRYFGKDYLDVGQKRRDTSIQVWRMQGEATAHLDIDLYGEGAQTTVRVRINAADARELARRLIDAAADIEAHQNETATQTAVAEVAQ